MRTVDEPFLPAEQRADLACLVATGADGPRVLVVVGEPGSGRTTVVGVAAEAGLAAGRRVLAVAGSPDEEAVPSAALSQLLLPFVETIDALPDAHRDALRRPLGLVSDERPFDLVATGMAVLALLGARPGSAPVLVTVDDADHVDEQTLAVLAFVARRMDRRRAVLLLTAESGRVPAPFERDTPRLRIGRLSDADAHALLERRGLPLDPALRRRIVDQSAGSPLVLLETAAAALLPGAAPRPFREPLRVGPVVEERVLARFRAMPPATQRLLGDAAVAESYSWATAHPAPMLHGELTDLGPAERAGIVRIDHAGVRFTHPAFWIAILSATPFADRVDAHRRLAESLTDQPRRRAWHLGHAVHDPDESVAALLEASAPEIGLQLGRLEEALTLERAAELSPDSDDRARRLLAAAGIAAPIGEIDWVDELTARARACVRDPGLRMRSIITSAWAAAARGRFSAAMADLSRAAAETIDTAPDAAWEVLSIAAAVGYQSGSRATQAQMLGAITRLAEANTITDPVASAKALWIETYLHPGVGTAERLDRLRTLTGRSPTDEPSLSRLAGAAWLDDDTETAFDLADAAHHRLAVQGAHASAAVIGPIRAWTAWDTGRWDDAIEYAAVTTRDALAAGGGMLAATHDAVAALVLAARGDVVGSDARGAAALAVIEGEECRSVVARVHQARGLAAMSAGRYADAYAHLSRMFREDGTPVHWHISWFGIADLAAAAVRSDQRDAGRIRIGHVLDGFAPEPAVRLRHLVLRARALLAPDDDTAEELFDAAQQDPAGSRWPFERAQLLLDHGSWLRRRRRIGEAKPLLAQAYEMFDALGAAAWKARAEGELRASHVDVPRGVGSLDELTGQQREIVLLAGQGLTNREIAARMYLSPRTVASHLYRSFPKLGIRDRWQLRDLVDGETSGD